VSVLGLAVVLALVPGLPAWSAGAGSSQIDTHAWAWPEPPCGLVDGTRQDRLSPVRTARSAGMVAVSAGYNHSLAVRSDGTAWRGQQPHSNLQSWTTSP